MAAITPTTSIATLGSATSQSKSGKQGGAFPGPGHLLEAMVLEAKESNRFLLNIAGRQINAQSNAPLLPGQTLQLQVLQTSPQIELKIVTSALGHLFGQSLTLSGKNIDLSQLIKAFRQQPPAETAVLRAGTTGMVEKFYSMQKSVLTSSESGSLLKNLVNQLGLHFENSIGKGELQAAENSLKAALLDISNSFQNVENIVHSTTKLLSLIELFQLAQLHTPDDRTFIFPLPLPFIEQSYLTIRYDEGSRSEENEDPKPNRFSLNLTMAELGNMQIDFLKTEDVLYIRFRTESQEKADFIARFDEQLKETLSSAPQIKLTFSADAPDPVTQLVQHSFPDGDSLINTRV